MRNLIHFDWLTGSRRAWLPALGVLALGALLAGCIAGFLSTTPTAGATRLAGQSARQTRQAAGPSGRIASGRHSGGVLPPGGRTHPSKQAMARMLKVSQCMRRHGISWFPNPTTSVPSSMAGIGMISNFDGALLVIPSALVIRSGSAYGKAVEACGHGLLGQPGAH
jgi:hypothetical protein